MHDFKNIMLAWASSVVWFFAAIEVTWVTVVSAVVLPIVFFAIGKSIDVAVQLYLHRRRGKEQ